MFPASLFPLHLCSSRSIFSDKSLHETAEGGGFAIVSLVVGGADGALLSPFLAVSKIFIYSQVAPYYVRDGDPIIRRSINLGYRLCEEAEHASQRYQFFQRIGHIITFILKPNYGLSFNLWTVMIRPRTFHAFTRETNLS